MTHRFFRATSDARYEEARAALDAIFAYPAGMTSICPAATAPRDAAGALVVAVNVTSCEIPAVAELLVGILASGHATEISEAEYFAAVPSRP